jgi:hypothetical protein
VCVTPIVQDTSPQEFSRTHVFVYRAVPTVRYIPTPHDRSLESSHNSHHANKRAVRHRRALAVTVHTVKYLALLSLSSRDTVREPAIQCIKFRVRARSGRATRPGVVGKKDKISAMSSPQICVQLSLTTMLNGRPYCVHCALDSHCVDAAVVQACYSPPTGLWLLFGFGAGR